MPSSINIANPIEKKEDTEKVKVTTSGSTTYIAYAPTGTAESAAAWKAFKIVTSGTSTVTTWADGDTKYDNVATDLTALSYS